MDPVPFMPRDDWKPLWRVIIDWFELNYGYGLDPSLTPHGDILRWAQWQRATTKRRDYMAQSPTPGAPAPGSNAPKTPGGGAPPTPSTPIGPHAPNQPAQAPAPGGPGKAA